MPKLHGARRWLALTFVFALAPTSTVLAASGAQEDTTGPQLEKFAFDQPVDVSDGTQEVTFRLRITDDLSGFDYGSLHARGPSSGQQRETHVASWNRINGDETDGTYEATMAIPQFSEAGSWHVGVHLVDKAGNWTLLSSYDLEAAGLPATLEVLSDPDDTTPPWLTAVDVSPRDVDVTAGPQQVTVYLSIADDVSGLHVARFRLESPSGRQDVLGAVWGSAPPGQDLEGTHAVVLAVPQYSEAGTWRLVGIGLTDHVENHWMLDGADALEEAGMALSLEVASEIEDVEAPHVQALEFSPAWANVSVGDADLTVAFEVTDDLSGFNGANLVLESPSMRQHRWVHVTGHDRVSGDALGGRYEVTATFPSDAEHGLWRVLWVAVWDRVGNVMFYETEDLAAASQPSEVQVGAFSPPSPPLEVAAAPGQGLGETDLAWRPPSDDGGLEVTGYNVYRDGDLIGQVDASTTSFTDEGRTAGTAHTYTTTALNPIGESASSEPACARPDPWIDQLEDVLGCANVGLP